MFEDGLQINILFELLNEFVNTNIDIENKNSENFQDEEEIADENVQQKDLKNMIGGKDNYIPKGLIPIEKLFDQNGLAKYPKVQPNENDIQDQNIGTEESPKIVKLLKNLLAEENKRYIDLMKNYTNGFSWIYEYMKEYDTSIIQRTIPIRPGEKPFRQKLRRINPMLFPLMRKR